MPAPHARPSNNPLTLAEEVLDKLDRSPWPQVVFLFNIDGRYSLKCYQAGFEDRLESPLAERVRGEGSGLEVGTYTRAIRADELVGDILCAMSAI